MARTKKAEATSDGKDLDKITTDKSDTSDSNMSERAATATDEPVLIEGRIGIQGVSSLIKRLETSLESDSPLVVDASNVQSIDIAALQVLVAYANVARNSARTVQWQCGDGVLQKCATLADLDRHLNLESAPPETESDDLCPVF